MTPNEYLHHNVENIILEYIFLISFTFQTHLMQKQIHLSSDLVPVGLDFLVNILFHFSIKKNTLLKLYGPFLWMGFNCLKARATSRRLVTKPS